MLREKNCKKDNSQNVLYMLAFVIIYIQKRKINFEKRLSCFKIKMIITQDSEFFFMILHKNFMFN